MNWKQEIIANVAKAATSIKEMQYAFHKHIEKEEQWQESIAKSLNSCPLAEEIHAQGKHIEKQNGTLIRMEKNIATMNGKLMVIGGGIFAAIISYIVKAWVL